MHSFNLAAAPCRSATVACFIFPVCYFCKNEHNKMYTASCGFRAGRAANLAVQKVVLKRNEHPLGHLPIKCTFDTADDQVVLVSLAITNSNPAHKHAARSVAFCRTRAPFTSFHLAPQDENTLTHTLRVKEKQRKPAATSGRFFCLEDLRF